MFTAVRLLESATEHDPRFGPALALDAVCRHHMDINGWIEDRDANRRTAVALARRALLVAGDGHDVLAYCGFALGYFGEDIGSAMALIDRALEPQGSTSLAVGSGADGLDYTRVRGRRR